MNTLVRGDRYWQGLPVSRQYNVSLERAAQAETMIDRPDLVKCAMIAAYFAGNDIRITRVLLADPSILLEFCVPEVQHHLVTSMICACLSGHDITDHFPDRMVRLLRTFCQTKLRPHVHTHSNRILITVDGEMEWIRNTLAPVIQGDYVVLDEGQDFDPKHECTVIIRNTDGRREFIPNWIHIHYIVTKPNQIGTGKVPEYWHKNCTGAALIYTVHESYKTPYIPLSAMPYVRTGLSVRTPGIAHTFNIGIGFQFVDALTDSIYPELGEKGVMDVLRAYKFSSKVEKGLLTLDGRRANSQLDITPGLRSVAFELVPFKVYALNTTDIIKTSVSQVAHGTVPRVQGYLREAWTKFLREERHIVFAAHHQFPLCLNFPMSKEDRASLFSSSIPESQVAHICSFADSFQSRISITLLYGHEDVKDLLLLLYQVTIWKGDTFCEIKPFWEVEDLALEHGIPVPPYWKNVGAKKVIELCQALNDGEVIAPFVRPTRVFCNVDGVPFSVKPILP